MALVYDRFLRQRLSRRRLLGATGGTAIGAAGLYLAGCGGSDNGPSTNNGNTPNPNETPTLDGIYNQRQANGFPSLSPFGLTALASSLVFGFITYDHLWYVPIDTGETEEMLAKDPLEIPDPDGTEVIATLNPSFFHDKAPVNGRAVEAEDVVQSWFAFRDDPFGLGREWLKSIMDVLEAPDTSTVRITQKQTWAWMFGTAGAGSPASSSVLPRETLTMGDLLRDDIIGSGRFFLESHRGGQNLKFRRHPRWRVAGEPWLAGTDLIYISDYSSAEAQFSSGGIDSLEFQNKLQADQMLGRLGDDKMTVTTDLSRAYHCLMMKTSVEPFNDPRVRKAFRLAINREEMIQLVERDLAGGELCCIVPPAQTLYALTEDDAEFQEYVRHDQEEARSLLDQANFPFDKEFTILISSPNEELAERAQVLQQQLDRVGVKTRIEPQDLTSVWVPRVLIQADYEMTLFTHLPYEDPYLPLAFYTSFSPIGPTDPEKGRNSMLFYDDEIDAAVNTASAELDLDSRIEKVKTAQKLIMDKEGPMINIYSSVSFTGRRSWLKNVTIGRGSYGLFNGKVWVDTAMRGS